MSSPGIHCIETQYLVYLYFHYLSVLDSAGIAGGGLLESGSSQTVLTRLVPSCHGPGNLYFLPCVSPDGLLCGMYL